MCVRACIYLHTDEKLYLKLLENKSNSDQNAFQAHYLEISILKPGYVPEVIALGLFVFSSTDIL